MEFEPLDGVTYRHNYVEIAEKVSRGEYHGLSAYRALILSDLWFLLYFGLKVEPANHKFVVNYCWDVEDGGGDYTLDLAAREHFKSTILTKAEVIQKILKNPESRIGIFSHTRPAAKAFLRSVKLTLESSNFLKECFKDVLYDNPQNESPKWSEDDGLIVRRSGFYNEATVEAWGLLEGMPTGKHFTHRVYDDIETADIVQNPDTIRKLKDMFDLSHNLGTMNGTHRVIGTPYHHQGVLQYLRELRDIEGNKVYSLRLKPATDNGLPNGKPVLLPQEKIDKLRTNEYTFNSQQLLNPTPIGEVKLNSEYLKEIDIVPTDCYKFMVIDSAGDNETKNGDAWAAHVIAVEPNVNSLGISKMYIVDSIIETMTESQAIERLARMYLNNGMIMQVGYERILNSTPAWLTHFVNALKIRGRHISEDAKTLVPLRHGGRYKVFRIVSALQWPLNNDCLFISKSVPNIYRERIKTEMDKFPYWHDDGLDAFAYVFDLIKEYNFQSYSRVKPIDYKRYKTGVL